MMSIAEGDQHLFYASPSRNRYHERYDLLSPTDC
jgi:hypothetical protein